ncbi:hypothetical protein FOMPIDRAFT_1054735 [Fomitopsis schrenkii]|uniref:Uncharacterized protein n=1 Tax=Fomitopsis schrenkii TaxID=2126942 RepID=S8F7K2_FOMSC|nr:hypothetical protein FOMPIDRAFT_1054735 [Fomitopsis schrenkii]
MTDTVAFNGQAPRRRCTEHFECALLVPARPSLSVGISTRTSFENSSTDLGVALTELPEWYGSRSWPVALRSWIGSGMRRQGRKRCPLSALSSATPRPDFSTAVLFRASSDERGSWSLPRGFPQPEIKDVLDAVDGSPPAWVVTIGIWKEGPNDDPNVFGEFTLLGWPSSIIAFDAFVLKPTVYRECEENNCAASHLVRDGRADGASTLLKFMTKYGRNEATRTTHDCYLSNAPYPASS